MRTKTKLSVKEIVQNADKMFHEIRWKGGIVVCPYCGSVHIKEYPEYHYRCLDCKRKFSDRTQSIFHGCRLPISTCMLAVYEMMVDNYISGNVLSVKLGINRKSAWLLQSKLRRCMEQDRWLLEGVIAQDEAYLGGCLSNYHYRRKWDLLKEKGILIDDNVDRYTKDEIYELNSLLKHPVFGMTTSDKVLLFSTPNPIKKEYLRYLYNKHVVGDSITVSDESLLYTDWEKYTGAELHTNNHHNNQYTTDDGYTSNAIENRFSWLKRGFGARITHCKYHQLYLNEFAFRFNTRNMSTYERFRTLIEHCIGVHYTYKDIREYNPWNELPVVKVRKKNKMTLEQIKELLDTGVFVSIEQNGRTYTRDSFRD